MVKSGRNQAHGSPSKQLWQFIRNAYQTNLPTTQYPGLSLGPAIQIPSLQHMPGSYMKCSYPKQTHRPSNPRIASHPYQLWTVESLLKSKETLAKAYLSHPHLRLVASGLIISFLHSLMHETFLAPYFPLPYFSLGPFPSFLKYLSNLKLLIGISEKSKALKQRGKCRGLPVSRVAMSTEGERRVDRKLCFSGLLWPLLTAHSSVLPATGQSN